MPRDDYYALVIGIARYPHLRPLQGPVMDAKCFCKWLLGWGEVPPENLWVITSGEEAGGNPPVCVSDGPLENHPDRAVIEVTVEERFERACRGHPPAGGHPIQDDIDTAFRELFKKARQGRPQRLYVYFAGHGCSKEFHHVALVMANATGDELEQSLNAPK